MRKGNVCTIRGQVTLYTRNYYIIPSSHHAFILVFIDCITQPKMQRKEWSACLNKCEMREEGESSVYDRLKVGCVLVGGLRRVRLILR